MLGGQTQSWQSKTRQRFTLVERCNGLKRRAVGELRHPRHHGVRAAQGTVWRAGRHQPRHQQPGHAGHAQARIQRLQAFGHKTRLPRTVTLAKCRRRAGQHQTLHSASVLRHQLLRHHATHAVTHQYTAPGFEVRDECQHRFNHVGQAGAAKIQRFTVTREVHRQCAVTRCGQGSHCA